MSLQHKQALWSGVLRFTPFLLLIILTLSIAILGLGAVYATQLLQAPLNQYFLEHRGLHRRSVASLVSYSVMTPFVTILHAALDLILFSHNSLPPTHALTVSIITLCTWGLQVAFWTQCDLRHNFAVTGTTCYQSNLDESMTGVSQGAGRARVAVGFSVIFLYIVYMSFAAAAVHKHRIQRQSSVSYPLEKQSTSERPESDDMS